jgi:ferredoxin-nitrite reductase
LQLASILLLASVLREAHDPSQLPALHRKGVIILPVRSSTPEVDHPLLHARPTCPGLFYPTPAQDGQLVRIRIPGGLLTSQQSRVLSTVSDRLSNGAIDITTRANVQIRGLQSAVPDPILALLQAARLAAPLSSVDHLRNIMSSPMAGIDPAQRLDTRPLVQALDHYLSSDPALAGLSAKFSIGLDGGERVSIRQQPNDLRFTAIDQAEGLSLQLSLARAETLSLVLQPADCVPVVAALAKLYLDRVRQMPQSSRKPRFKQILATVDLADLEQDLIRQVSRIRILRPLTTDRIDREGDQRWETAPLGIQPQQDGRSALGIALPLGQLTSDQLRHLADLAETYGSGSLRLTPWRSLLLPDLPAHSIALVQQAIDRLGLSTATASLWGGLVACSGKTGCAASATDTQADAHQLVQVLEQQLALELALDQPLTIHFSGCPKSCAHHSSSDITLVGIQTEPIASYHLYIGDAEPPFGRQIAANLSPAEVPQRLADLLSAYQQQRSKQQTFREFANQP